MSEDGRSSRLDRVGAPRGGPRNAEGKEALFSTAPTAPETSQLEVFCRRYGTTSGVDLIEVPRMLVPPFLWNPASGLFWGRCPACRHRARLQVRTGQALRALAEMLPFVPGRAR